MSFFSQEVLANTTTSFSNDSSFEVIPDGTKALAVITNAEWREANQHNERHVSLTWDIVEGEFKGRKVFQKVKLFDKKETTRLNAQRMIIAIDANCKGAIAQAGVEPTAQGLASLLHSPMYIMIKVYTPDNPEQKPHNWVCAVSERKCGAQQAQQTQTATKEPSVAFDDSEDIPFAPIGLMYPNVAIHVI